jgi:uncharacterized iron-regulated membrane protein
MSEQRLILPKRPHHHKHRLAAALAVCGLAVAGVWGVQMKMTFDRFSDGDKTVNIDALTQAKSNLRLNESASAVQEGVDVIRDMVEQAAAEQAAKDAVLDQVGAGMKAEIEAGASAGTLPTPAVAGETSETTPPGLPLAGEEDEVN